MRLHIQFPYVVGRLSNTRLLAGDHLQIMVRVLGWELETVVARRRVAWSEGIILTVRDTTAPLAGYGFNPPNEHGWYRQAIVQVLRHGAMYFSTAEYPPLYPRAAISRVRTTVLKPTSGARACRNSRQRSKSRDRGRSGAHVRRSHFLTVFTSSSSCRAIAFFGAPCSASLRTAP